MEGLVSPIHHQTNETDRAEAMADARAERECGE